MKNKALLTLTTLLLAGTLVACGAKKGESSNPTSSSSEPEIEVTPWPEDFQAEVDAILVEYGVTDKLPGIVGGLTYEVSEYSSYISTQIEVEYGSADEVAEALTLYASNLLEGQFTELGEDSYGDMIYLSPNAQYKIGPWNGAEYDEGNYLIIDFELYYDIPTDSFPNEFVAAYFDQFDVTIPSMPNYTSAQEVTYEAEYSYYETLDVYINYTSGETVYEEMVAYVAQVEPLGWTSEQDEYGDYSLVLNADTNVTLYIGDYWEYIIISFEYVADL